MTKRVLNWSKDHRLMKMANLHKNVSVQFSVQKCIDENASPKQYEIVLYEINDQHNQIGISRNNKWCADIDKATGEISSAGGSIVCANQAMQLAAHIQKSNGDIFAAYKNAIVQVYKNRVERAMRELETAEFTLKDIASALYE